mmetsp:Transcript_38548/g.81081  ORF Transcript_38548/g.81081 Transcript_38548/m.81081 type:complete len:291 (+) Transcript_38548:353-1225(+)|eukprot:CAMPEP_0183703024 /NCGR_PEP_ID=MMETSP0737-20130205/924_1 /TAXON_ID=385413 /ORGANISM="Thalassiosira miniscula, Strain CCMP1093" /LENGTH=290 /DNA_ID=CAMNT_0025929721 /DNA_START=293 /DNA_END=1165 /DNA_ORIENTATION=-
MNLILIQPNELSLAETGEGAVNLPPDDHRTRHIVDHLKKETGDSVSVGFATSSGGCKGKALVAHRENGGVRLVLQPKTMVHSPKEPEITLILAVPFPARLKYLWPVITSFSSVVRVVIVKGKLTNPEFCESKALKPSVYEPMIEKGMSQGGRIRPVKVDVCLEDISRELLERLGLVDNDNNADGIARIFLDCGDESKIPPPARDVVIEQCKIMEGKAPSAIVAVGPERGWTDEEMIIFVEECGFQSAMLGSSILRVDTAVVSGLGIVSAALDECQSASEREREQKRQKLP